MKCAVNLRLHYLGKEVIALEKSVKNIQQLNKLHSPRAKHSQQGSITTTQEPWKGQDTYLNNNYSATDIRPGKINIKMAADVMHYKDTNSHVESTNKIHTDV